MFLEVEYKIKMLFRGKEANINALLSEKIWFTVMSERSFSEKFGPLWMKLKKPCLFVVKGEKIEVDKVIVVDIKIGDKTYRETIYVSDELINALGRSTEFIIGKKFLEKNRIRILA